MTDITEQHSLRDYLRIVFKHKIMISVIVIFTLITVHIGLEMRTPEYEAKVQMYVKGVKDTESEFYQGISSGIQGTHNRLVASTAVIDRVIKVLKLYERPYDYEKQFATKLKRAFKDYKSKNDKNMFEGLSPEQKALAMYRNAFNYVKSNLLVYFSEDSAVFEISFTDYSPRMAGLIANSLSRSYVIFDLEQQILELGSKYGDKNATVLQLKDYIKDFEKHLDGQLLPALEALGPASVKIIQQAGQGALIRAKPNKTIARILSLIMSISLGVLLSFGLEYFDQTIKSQKDIESVLRLKFLGSIPMVKVKDKLLMNGTNPGVTSYTNSYERLAHKLFIEMTNTHQNALLISDAEDSDETVYVIANLAFCISRIANSKVLVIDAGLRNPAFHDIFNIDITPGLSDVLEGDIALENVIQNIDSHLYVLPAGTAVSIVLNALDSVAMSDVLKKAKEQFEIVLVRCADISSYTDAVILSKDVDGLILACNDGKVKLQIMKHALAPFEEKKIDVVGAILYNRKHYIPKFIYRIT